MDFIGKSDKSIHQLISDLCQTQINKHKLPSSESSRKHSIKKLRYKAFEILLKKSHPRETPTELLNDRDPLCQLLSWEFLLKYHYDKNDRAVDIEKCVTCLESSGVLKNETIKSVVLLLLYLQEKNDFFVEESPTHVKLSLAHISESDTATFNSYSSTSFLQSSHAKEKSSMTNFSINDFSSHVNLGGRKRSNHFIKSVDSCRRYAPSDATSRDVLSLPSFEHVLNFDDIIYDEGYVSSHSTEDIWSLVLNQPLEQFCNWEFLDNIYLRKELPFASECGPWTVQEIQKIYYANIFTHICFEDRFFNPIFVSMKELVRAVRFLLIGIPSKLFSLNENDGFELKKGISIQGVTVGAFESCCSDLIYCGTCYRSLWHLTNINAGTVVSDNGYVFKEFGESVKRYLAYYRIAILAIPEDDNILAVHEYIYKLKFQIGTLVKVSQLDIYSHPKNQRVPRASELLTNLYQELTNVVDRNIILVLFSAFYPCCQVYFKRFVQRWLYEGVLVDRYEEFYIKADNNFTSARFRTYWTKQFYIKQNDVPEFLQDLKSEILQCGKTVNLLKLCKPESPLCTNITDDMVQLITCCLTEQKLSVTKDAVSTYYIETASLCGPRISLSQKLREQHEQDELFLNLIEQKRALTLKKIEMKRQIEAEEVAKRKRKLYEDLKEQMELAIAFKKKEKEEELRQELLIAEKNAKLEELRAHLLKQETDVIINYYNELFEAVEDRRACIERRKKELLNNDASLETRSQSNTNIKQNDSESLDLEIIMTNSLEYKDSDASMQTATSHSDLLAQHELLKQEDLFENMIHIGSTTEIIKADGTRERYYGCKGPQDLSPTKIDNLDQVNANVKKTENDTKETSRKSGTQNNTNKETSLRNNDYYETCMAAKRNRAKVMNLEFATDTEKILPINSVKIPGNNKNLTEAQRIKLKVMRAEYQMYGDSDMSHAHRNIQDRQFTVHNNNELTKSPSVDIFYSCHSFGNMASPGQENVMNTMHRRNLLTLPKHIEQLNEENKNSDNCTEDKKLENEIIPMSIGSTPITECASTELLTPASVTVLFVNSEDAFGSATTLDSAVLTSDSHVTEDGFKFPNIEQSTTFNNEHPLQSIIDNKEMLKIVKSLPKLREPLRMSENDVEEVFCSDLKFLLYESVAIPLDAQMRLANREIIKFFLTDQQLFSHLHSLRCYFFLMDGEFGRHITESLFNKLYEVDNPVELLNGRCLQLIMNKAICSSSKTHRYSERLSFTIEDIPKRFDLSSADVLNCLSLTYKVNWPLNIILPVETIGKYQQIFKYLLKLDHISWILRKMFQELKLSNWRNANNDDHLMLQSPQYHRLQLYRHVMTHFIQTLQNYTVDEVLQTSWEELKHNVDSVTTLDQLYSVHVLYVKTIIFRCLLNKKCAPIMKVINEIFVVILMFYNQLRARNWRRTEGSNIKFKHPSFKKLEDIFYKFEEFARFVFRVGQKMAHVGYQPHLVQMLGMLNMSGYYNVNK